MKKLFFSAILGGLTLASCSSDDDVTPENTELEIPATYNFEREGVSTVSYSGQTTRLQMTSEILSKFTDFENGSEDLLLNMFANENAPFENASLNESSKSVKSKVAASKLYFSANTVESAEIKSDFDSYITEQFTAVKDNRNELAEAAATEAALGRRITAPTPSPTRLQHSR